MSGITPAHTKRWLEERAWWSANWRSCLATLDSERALTFVKMHYGLDDNGQPSADRQGSTLKYLGVSYNCSPERVKMQINETKNLLQSPLEPQSYVVMRMPRRFNPPVKNLPLSQRLLNRLAERIGTLNELLALTEEDILKIPSVGDHLLKELTEYLEARGLKLAQPVS
ncbi:hypothetical protein EPO04_02720 [Patescibacteria group bacterium]|nr:MAG: hypothetical protein EPO04_02720 [Patescibacteria group bacterium]